MDTFSAAAASRLATKIQVYWASRGVAGIKAWAEPLEILTPQSGKPMTVYQVRSNIVERLLEHSYSDPVLQRVDNRAV